MVPASPSLPKWLAWLPDLPKDIWILATGQLLLFIGQGFTMVYASIYFVNELGFSPTQVGFALGSSGISSLVGRFWAGYAIDSPTLGRRKTLLLSTVIAAIACCCLAFATTFPLLVAGNLCLGMGLSLYWPATMAVTTDLTTAENRTEAFALTRLADNLGLGLGAFLAGQYIAFSGGYQALFLGKGVAYLVCGIVVYWAIAETVPIIDPSSTRRTNDGESCLTATADPDPLQRSEQPPQQVLNPLVSPPVRSSSLSITLQNWKMALSDRPFLTYLAANLFFTTYVAQVSSTLPLFLANQLPNAGLLLDGGNASGFSSQSISYFFVWHAVIKILFQLPITRWLKSVPHTSILITALIFWMVAFGLLWLPTVLPSTALFAMIGAFSVIAMGEILYAPAAMTLVGMMAPTSLRGIYFSLESQCWGLGFMIGPPLGGWALEHPALLGPNIWLLFAGTVAIAGALVLGLKRQLASPSTLVTPVAPT